MSEGDTNRPTRDPDVDLMGFVVDAYCKHDPPCAEPTDEEFKEYREVMDFFCQDMNF